jgi:transitional endoplasmic reticulum ATPase
MAEALASQADARFFHVQVSDIVSKWYGESEQIVKSIFELAGQNGEKTIIFFDEIDALAQRREGAHEATQRVMSTLLENMDGMASKNNIMVLASTNRLDSIDPALLRAGRFDRWVEVPLPDDEGKKQIFNIHMLKAEKNAGRALFNQVSLDAIIPNTENTSGADIAEIVRRVLEEKVRQEGMGQEPSLVSTEDVLRELKNYERTRKTKRSFSLVPPDQK